MDCQILRLKNTRVFFYIYGMNATGTKMILQTERDTRFEYKQFAYFLLSVALIVITLLIAFYMISEPSERSTKVGVNEPEATPDRSSFGPRSAVHVHAT